MAMKHLGEKARIWLRALRFQFLQASLLPVLLGSAVAYRDGVFTWKRFILIVLAMSSVHLGANLANDYFDHRSGADARNQSPTPFSGGSRVIQEGLLPAEKILSGALICYAIGIATGLYLVAISGWGLLWIGFLGASLSFFYTAPPLKLGYRGWGEFLVALLLGPLAVIGAYYVYAGSVTVQVFWVSLPVGLLVSGILYINQFPDVESDAASGKRHWIARQGKKRAVFGFLGILAGAYASLLLATVLGFAPLWTLLAFLTLPLAVRAFLILQGHFDHTPSLIPAMGMTIGIHLLFGILLITGLLVDLWLSA